MLNNIYSNSKYNEGKSELCAVRVGEDLEQG